MPHPSYIRISENTTIFLFHPVYPVHPCKISLELVKGDNANGCECRAVKIRKEGSQGYAQFAKLFPSRDIVDMRWFCEIYVISAFKLFAVWGVEIIFKRDRDELYK
jgi:hypothetical protein